MIKRGNPDVGYISDDVFEAYASTQSIRAGIRNDLQRLGVVEQ